MAGLTEKNMEGLISISEMLRELVNRVGRAGTWLLVPLVLITMWDVVARKLVWIQIFMVENFGSFFESTLMQEMEWHLHTAVFCLVLGMGYTHNRHVRVDFIRENMKFNRYPQDYKKCSMKTKYYCVIVLKLLLAMN